MQDQLTAGSISYKLIDMGPRVQLEGFVCVLQHAVPLTHMWGFLPGMMTGSR